MIKKRFKLQDLINGIRVKAKKNEFRDPKSEIDSGFTLFELVVTLTVLAVLVMGTIPLAENAVKRQRELRLRESLRMIRSAIDEFKRDTVGACPQGAVTTTNPVPPDQRGGGGGGFGGGVAADPRSRVVIDDCKIFETENIDRYPPDLQTLVDGVRVKPRGINIKQGSVFGEKDATEINEEKEITKVYLREIPIDPMTGKTDTWQLRSSYQTADATRWDDVNVFDVRSGSDEEALNGEKYSDW